MRKVNENVDMIRSAKGISKRQMAKYSGISEMSCNRLLWGESRLPADLLKKFAECLGIEDINIFFSDALTDAVIASLAGIPAMTTV